MTGQVLRHAVNANDAWIAATAAARSGRNEITQALVAACTLLLPAGDGSELVAGTSGRQREYIIGLDEAARIRCCRSEHHPYEYAFILELRVGERWEARISADNSHSDMHDAEHHYHRYKDGNKLPAQPLPFQVADANDAMGKIQDWFKANWKELTE